MLSFKQFISKIKSVFSVVIDKLKKALSTLGFGKTTVIELSVGSMKTEAVDTGGKQAQMGYFSEFVTAQEIINQLSTQKLSIAFNGSKSKPLTAITKKVNDYNKMLLEKYPTEKEEINRQYDAGKQMGIAIFNDAIANGEDQALLDFNVVLTGDSLKGENKADIVVEVRKHSTEEVVDDIMASLKSYKKWSINLANNTLTSFFDNVGIPMTAKFKKELATLQGVRAFVWKAYKNDDLASIKSTYGADVAKAAAPLFKKKWNGVNKANAKQKAIVKNAHDVIQEKISSTFVKHFRAEYKKNKEAINKKILVNLGFDGSDDFYLAVSDSKGMKVLSNRTSDAYKQLVDNIQKDFNLQIDYKPTAPTTVIVNFYSPDGTKILDSKLSIGQTGSLGQSRTNWWVNFGKFKKDAR